MKLVFLCLAILIVTINGKKLTKRQAIQFGDQTLPDPNECTTPDGVAGDCVDLRECSVLNDELRAGRPSTEFLSFLRRSVCRYIGRLPIICCPKESEDIAKSPSVEPTTRSTTTILTESPTQPSSTTQSSTTQIQTEPSNDILTELPLTELLTELPIENPTQSPNQIPITSELPTELPIDSSIEPLAESPIEPIAESPIEPIAVSPIEPLTESPIEPLTESPIEPLTESPIEPLTESPIEPLTESPIESPTEAPIENPTQPPTQITTTTEVHTVAPTETPALTGFALLPRSKCGLVGVQRTRIVGGRIAKKGSWPWLVALGYKTLRGGMDFLCGGALITERHVLTAAHCVQGRTDLTIVRLGEHDLDTDDEAEHEDFNILEKIIHENYNTRTFDNDISILKMEKPVTFKKHIVPVCLPTHDFFINNTLKNFEGVVAGWGTIAYNNVSSPILKETKLPIRTNEDCRESYAIFRSVVVDEFRLCAGRGGTDACQGDSGGPLVVVAGRSGVYATIGVVSVGYRCAEPNFPGIYTRVTSYLDWIANNLD